MKTVTVVLALRFLSGVAFAQGGPPAASAKVSWKGDMAMVEETVTDPKTGNSANWTVQFDWQQGRHVEIVAKTGSTSVTLSFYGSEKGPYMIETKGRVPEFWNRSNGVHYLDNVQQPNSAKVPEETKENIRPAMTAIFAAADAVAKDTPSWKLDRRYPGLQDAVAK